MTIPQTHQLKIARRTMRLSCIGAVVLGGPNHYDAARIIHELTGVFVNIDADCTCSRPNRSSLESAERAWARGDQ